jgi:membrane protein involved in colicin uptake
MAERGRMAKAKSMASRRKKPTSSAPSNPRMARARRSAAARAERKASAPAKSSASPRAARAQRSAAARAEQKANAPARTPANPRAARSASRSPKPSTGRFGVGSAKTIMRNGKELANVSAEQLERTGLTLRQYMNQWNRTGRRPR